MRKLALCIGLPAALVGFMLLAGCAPAVAFLASPAGVAAVNAGVQAGELAVQGYEQQRGR